VRSKLLIDSHKKEGEENPRGRRDVLLGKCWEEKENEEIFNVWKGDRHNRHGLKQLGDAAENPIKKR